jgi:predicted DCC family thiol-disulfide oxidoreductase YuxK
MPHPPTPTLGAEALLPQHQSPPQPLMVLYDGACPLCRREIGLYRRLQPLPSGSPVCFADVSDAAGELPGALPPGTTREQWLARFHVRRADGEWLHGAPAFLALWAVLPGWRWLARLGRLPGMAGLMERAYCVFLRWRPWLQRWAARLEKPCSATTQPPSPTASAGHLPSPLEPTP